MRRSGFTCGRYLHATQTRRPDLIWLGGPAKAEWGCGVGQRSERQRLKWSSVSFVPIMWRALASRIPRTGSTLADEVGLKRGPAQSVLTGDAFSDAVRADEPRAVSFGINGVPFFAIDETYGISGAQPVEAMLAGLRQAIVVKPRKCVIRPDFRRDERGGEGALRSSRRCAGGRRGWPFRTP